MLLVILDPGYRACRVLIPLLMRRNILKNKWEVNSSSLHMKHVFLLLQRTTLYLAISKVALLLWKSTTISSKPIFSKSFTSISIIVENNI